MKEKEMIKKIMQDSGVQRLHEIIIREKDYYGLNLIKLTGGAVVDILEDRIPKDYDLVGAGTVFHEILLKNGFEFQHETKTATTFRDGLLVVQLLHTKKDNFDFKISQASFGLKSLKLDIDTLSFELKTLIPTRIAFEKAEAALSSLTRIPHWQNKGYHIPEKTYLSLLAMSVGDTMPLKLRPKDS